jgi:hypothetical protein
MHYGGTEDKAQKNSKHNRWGSVVVAEGKK